MAIRPPYFPPLTGTIHPPLTDHPGYIMGSSGKVAGFGSRDFYVAAVPAQTARAVIIQHHYSHRVVQNSYVHLGVYLHHDLVGVLQLGHMINPRSCAKLVANTGQYEYLELNRMWLDDVAPRNSESRALSYAMKYLKRACPHVKWVQSFADERCGCLGVVYQAANFLYLGSHTTTFYELDGEAYHPMLLTAHTRPSNRGRTLAANIHRAIARSLRQYRYIYFIKPQFKRDLRVLPKPYPKQ